MILSKCVKINIPKIEILIVNIIIKKSVKPFLFFIYYNGDIMSKETFKLFARAHPELASSVLKGNTSWQQLYELYEIYGENNSIWNQYFTTPSITDNITSSASTIKDFISSFKNMDMDSVQKGITNIQKTISLLQEIGLGSRNNNVNYEARPIYKRFED